MVIKLERPKNTNAHSGKTSLPWVIACISILILAVGGCIGMYFLGQTNGYDTGYTQGYTNGHDDGEKAGYSSGRANGYNTGYSAGYDKGYNDGYQDMWEKANCIINGGGYTCL